jgi:predicted RNase H-like HicB family nuclease
MSNEERFSINLRWSDVDEAYLAEVPELPGCIADGATRQEAVAAVEVVMREWIEAAKELGRRVPEPTAS